MKPVRTIFKSLYGSRLYGTATPESDTDWKSVHLPSGRGVLLGQHEDTFDKNDNSFKNGAGDNDDESHSLRKFLRMAAGGEMLAIELLHVPDAMIEHVDPVWEDVRSLAPKIITSQCLGFVGYTQRQAAKYGIKGSRLNDAKATSDLLNALISKSSRAERLAAHADEIAAFAMGRHHVSVETRSAGFSEKPFLVVCDRKIAFTMSLQTGLDIVEAALRSYGKRAESASENANVDWKSTMHAVRVASQAVELLETGKITFPRPDAEYLLAIRRGAFTKDQAAQMLEESLDNVARAEKGSPLPTKPDEAAIDELLMKVHLEQVTGADA